jgi:hypothetical protein
MDNNPGLNTKINISESLNNLEDINVNSSRKNLFATILFFLILVLIGGLGVFFLLIKQTVNKNKKSILNTPLKKLTQHPSIIPTEEIGLKERNGLKAQVIENDVLLTLGVGYQIAIDKSWDVKIVESGKQHNFLTASVSNFGVRIEIEAFSHNLPNWEKYLKNELYRFEKEEIKIINNHKVKVGSGKEIFAQSKAKLIMGTWDDQNKTLFIRVIGSDEKLIKSLFDTLASSVSPIVKKRSFNNIIKEVFAAENAVPINLPIMEYKQIEVMGEPLEDEITNIDIPYKDGYAKGYRFFAFKSQKLASYANEDISKGRSYIYSQLFDFNGNPISDEMNTHIEFKAPYTGEYFLIVWTFDKQEGKITVMIDDHDQLECQSIIKYPDGAELMINPEERSLGGNILVGEFDVGYIYQCPRPITVINNNFIQFETVPRTSGEIPKIISWEVNVFVSTSTSSIYKPKEGKETFAIRAEDDDRNKVGFKIQQLGANRILITPETGLFPKKSQVVIRRWGSRFFTQSKLIPPDIPILKEILEKFADDFSPKNTYDLAAIEPIYFDWKKDNNIEIELYGGQLIYRKKILNYNEGVNLLDKYKQYFIDKGYGVSDLNNYQEQSSQYPTRQKLIVALSLNQTVCKLVYDSNIFSIYCANLQ